MAGGLRPLPELSRPANPGGGRGWLWRFSLDTAHGRVLRRKVPPWVGYSFCFGGITFALFGILLAFGFTGTLLPWDRRAYWATVVGTQMVETLPLAGKPAAALLRGGEEVTGITLLRFYALRVFWLPVATFAFLWAHFHMIRRQGISGGL